MAIRAPDGANKNTANGENACCYESDGKDKNKDDADNQRHLT